MKLFAMALLFVSSSAFACPNLQGSWQCKNSDGSETPMTISQNDVANGVVYHINDGSQDTDYIADGVVRTYTQDGVNGKMVASCNGSAVQGSMELSGEGFSIAAQFNYALKSSDAISGSVKALVKQAGQADQNINIDSNCARK